MAFPRPCLILVTTLLSNILNKKNRIQTVTMSCMQNALFNDTIWCSTNSWFAYVNILPFEPRYSNHCNIKQGINQTTEYFCLRKCVQILIKKCHRNLLDKYCYFYADKTGWIQQSIMNFVKLLLNEDTTSNCKVWDSEIWLQYVEFWKLSSCIFI